MGALSAMAFALPPSPLNALSSIFPGSHGGVPDFSDIPLGFQTFPIRDMLGKDFPGTLKTMAGMGYQLVELCSPVGYKDIGFAFLGNMTTGDILRTINDAGLRCPSCHFGFSELTNQLDASILAQESARPDCTRT